MGRQDYKGAGRLFAGEISIERKMTDGKEKIVVACGSCLYPQLVVQDVLEKEEEIDRRIFLYPTSAVEEQGKKISYPSLL